MPSQPTTGEAMIALLEDRGPAGDMSRRLLTCWPAAVAAWRGTKRRILEVWAETAGEQLAAVLTRGVPLMRTGACKADGSIDPVANRYLLSHAVSAAGPTTGGPDAALQSRVGQLRAENAALRARLAAYERALQDRERGGGGPTH